ncbi:MAG TPA: amidohydrolase, partial [Thermoanaerobaculia bacterium]|nr:amidohydrolase [Thermoanaerobaculia bacterium]
MKLQRLLVASLLVASFARADAPGVYAITNATVHPVSGPDIDRGTVLIRDGLIEAVGAGIAIPADASVIDAAGQHVYPGLFDAQTALGLVTATPERGREREGERERRPPEPDAAWAAAEHLTLTDTDLDARRFVGVTTVVAAPRTGIFNGQSVVLNLGEGNAASRIVRSPAAFQVSYN